MSSDPMGKKSAKVTVWETSEEIAGEERGKVLYRIKVFC
jgi:hypothetical protein